MSEKKIIKIKLVSEQEKPEDKIVHDIKIKELDDHWLGCMESYLGRPPSMGGEWEKPPFEQGVLFCAVSTERKAFSSGLEWSLSQPLLNQAKKMWSSSYRPEPAQRDSNEYIHKITLQLSRGSQSDLNNECQMQYGAGWTYDAELGICVYLESKTNMRLPLEKKIKTLRIKV